MAIRNTRWWLGLVAISILPYIQADDGKMPITTSSSEAKQLYYDALKFMDTSRPERARPLLEKALELDPNFIMAVNALRQTAPTFKVGREIFERLKAMIGNVPVSEGENLFFEAFQAAIDGDQAKRQEILGHLVHKYPKDERLLFQYAGTYYNSDLDKAIDIFEQVKAINGHFIPVYNTLGYAYRQQGEIHKAEMAFKQSIELDKENPNGYDSYAELLLKLGRHQDSISNYDKALAIDPLFPSAQIGVASNLCLLGRYSEARERLAKLFEIAPHAGMKSGIHWAMAVTYADEGKFDKCLEELHKNYAISKENADTAAMALDLRNIARVQLEQGHVEQALETYATAHEMNMNDPNQNARGKAFTQANFALTEAQLACEMKSFAKAEEKLAVAKGLIDELNNPFMQQGYQDVLGILAQARGQHAQAIEHYQQGNATDAYNMYRIGLAYESLGQSKQARDMFQYVVDFHSPLNFNYSFVRKKAAIKLKDRS